MFAFVLCFVRGSVVGSVVSWSPGEGERGYALEIGYGGSWWGDRGGRSMVALCVEGKFRWVGFRCISGSFLIFSIGLGCTSLRSLNSVIP
jgi:hypothetical protein